VNASSKATHCPVYLVVKAFAKTAACIDSGEDSDNRVSKLNVGQTVEFRYNNDDTLAELAVIHSPFDQTVAKHSDRGWTIEQQHREAEIYIEHANATIDSSLFLAGARAGLPDNLIMELADIYGHVIDFVYEIREGDQFIVTFEKRYLDGEFIEYGNILAAEFINAGESFVAVRYTDTEGDTGYYDQNGVSLRKAFLRAPLNFRRISSNFKLARKHPILGKMRAHKGTDYAASTGTPIYAAGDGKITFRGTKGGYGRTVIIKHGNSIETRYAHLSRYGKFKSGQKGQTRPSDRLCRYELDWRPDPISTTSSLSAGSTEIRAPFSKNFPKRSRFLRAKLHASSRLPNH
jgi:murein DD-endopeptidase MepM/ murein hydrolase activator NlpD